MMPKHCHNLFQVLLPLQRVLAPCLCVHGIVPIGHTLGSRFPCTGLPFRRVLERVPPTHDLPVDDTQGKDVTADIVSGPILDHSFGGHELPHAAKLLARDVVGVVADAAEAKIGQAGQVPSTTGAIAIGGVHGIVTRIDQNVFGVQVAVVEATFEQMVEACGNVHGQVEFVDQGGCFGQDLGFGEDADQVTVLVVLHDHEALGFKRVRRGRRRPGLGGFCGDAVELGEVVVVPTTAHDLDLKKHLWKSGSGRKKVSGGDFR